MGNDNGKLTANAIHILNQRYFHQDEGETSWGQLADRVADAVSQAEETQTNKTFWRDVFANLIYNLKFVPSTPCLMNADRNRPGQLSSCFILDVRDNIESICEVDAQLSKIFQKNGGGGLNISTLRPAKSIVETSKGYSSGPIGFMRKYDFTADQMTENNSRKGAIKVDLNDWHPDIFEFIHSKDDLNMLHRMNISVSLSDAFMWAVINNQPWDLKFPDYTWNKDIYDKEWNGDIEAWEAKGYPIKVYKTVLAQNLYREIMECAWRSGEPGVSFRDTMDRHNPNPHLGKIFASNPCAEFVSIVYNSCNLGSINLMNMFGDPDNTDTYENREEEFFSELGKTVPKAVRFLDNMITINKLPLKKIEEVTKAVRSVGLGVMGFADLLYILGIRYNSPEGYAFAKKLFAFMHEQAMQASMELALEKGTYPSWDGSVWSQRGIKVRNSNFLSIAPTGSISFIVNTSGGIEPVYSLVMMRTTGDGYKYFMVDPIFERELRKRGLYSEEILDKIAANNGSCQGISDIPEDMQKVFVTTYDISPEEHVKMLSIIQASVDLSVSKTVNLPTSATVQDVMDVYIQAWKSGIKGITIYRDKCRDGQVLTVARKEEKKVIINDTGYVDVNPAMEVAFGKRIKVKTGCGHLWIFFFVDDKHNLAEIWTQVSGGGCKANIESMSRLASLCFRANVDPKHILDQLSSAFCKTSMENVQSKSCGHVIAKEIRKFLEGNRAIIEVDKDRLEQVLALLNSSPKKIEDEEPSLNQIPSSEPRFQKEIFCADGTRHVFSGEGCPSCVKCGYSKCN